MWNAVMALPSEPGIGARTNPNPSSSSGSNRKGGRDVSSFGVVDACDAYLQAKDAPLEPVTVAFEPSSG